MSKIRAIKLILWLLTITLSLATIFFAYKQSFYQSAYSFIFLAYLLFMFDKLYFYREIVGSTEFTYTEVFQIMLVSSKKKAYNGFSDWENFKDMRILRGE